MLALVVVDAVAAAVADVVVGGITDVATAVAVAVVNSFNDSSLFYCSFFFRF